MIRGKKNHVHLKTKRMLSILGKDYTGSEDGLKTGGDQDQSRMGKRRNRPS